MSWLICLPLSGFPTTFSGMREMFLQREKQSFQSLKDIPTCSNDQTPTFKSSIKGYVRNKSPITADDFSLGNGHSKNSSRRSTSDKESYIYSFSWNGCLHLFSSTFRKVRDTNLHRAKDFKVENQPTIPILLKTNERLIFPSNNRENDKLTISKNKLGNYAVENGSMNANESSHHSNSNKSFKTNVISILKNPVFMFLTLGGALDGLILNGFAAFLPKYLEMQFDVSAEKASLYVGIVTVPAGMFGMFLGGYFIKRFNVNVKGMLRIVFLTSFFNFACMFILLLYCPETKLREVNYEDPFEPKKSQSGLPFPYKNTCNAFCNCDFNYRPVCAVNSGITFYSACHAGCRSSSNRSTTTKNLVFQDCLCDVSNTNLSHTKYLQAGKCPLMCNILQGYPDIGSSTRILIVLFLCLIFWALFLLLMVAVVSVNVTLNVVENNENSLALGIQWVFVRLLGTIPGPIIFGKIIDLNCLLWEIKSYSVQPPNQFRSEERGLEEIEYGACKLYNNRNMALSLFFLTFICKCLAQTFYGLSYFYYSKYYTIYQSFLTNVIHKDVKPSAESVQEDNN